MGSVFAHSDYRAFLRERLAELKARDPAFTYAVLAARAGFKSRGFITQVLQGKSRLTPDMARRFASALRLRKGEAEYFASLAGLEGAKDQARKNAFAAKLAGLKSARAKTLDKAQFEYYKKWYYSALRSALGYLDFRGDWAALARALSPAIKPAQARKAVRLLVKLGLVREEPGGRYRLTDRLITSGAAHGSVAVVNYQLEAMDLAKRALERIPKERRASVTLTLGLSPRGEAEAREMLARLRRELMDLAARDRGIDRVLQINLHAFPLTRLPEEGT